MRFELSVFELLFGAIPSIDILLRVQTGVQKRALNNLGQEGADAFRQLKGKGIRILGLRGSTVISWATN